MLNFVKKSLKEIRPKILNLYDSELLSPHFYTYSVEILVKRTDLGIPQRHKILSESLKGFCTWPAGYCIASEVMHIDF